MMLSQAPFDRGAPPAHFTLSFDWLAAYMILNWSDSISLLKG